ncbi:MAG TPA: ABC transporter substrate-binding protein [Gemmatimonadales bacterium]|nr:ABC transporter substrate-binding protein [Gemmatimonadales bacterium]
MTRRRLLAAAAGWGAAAALAPAAGSVRPSAAQTASGRIVFAMWQSPESLDPGTSGLISAGYVGSNMFDPLVWHLPGMHTGQEYFPGLAVRWEISSDARRYTFRLRKDVKFHDGTPFNAQAVKETLGHIVNPETRSRSAITALGPYSHTEVKGDDLVTVVFKEPNGSFLNTVATSGLSPISPAALRQYGHRGVSQHPVGTGPFMFKEWVPGSHVTLLANPDYNWAPSVAHHQGPPHLAEVTFRIIADASTRFNALRTGEVLIAENLAPPDVSLLQRAPNVTVFAAEVTGMPYAIMVNTKRPPTDDLKVRQALEFATNQEAIIEALYKGIYGPSHNIFLPTTLSYDPSLDKVYQPNPERAKGLLEEAGWKVGSGGVRQKGGQPLVLRFINIANFGFDQISQLLQAQWQELGIQTEISAQSFPTVAEIYNKGEHNLADFFFYSVDPFLMRALYACDQAAKGFNWMHYCDPQVDDLVAKGNGTADPTKRIPFFRQAAKIVTEAAVVIPIYRQRALFEASNRVQALRFTVNGYPIFYDATLRA